MKYLKATLIVIWLLCGCLLDSCGLVFGLAFAGVMMSTAGLGWIIHKEEESYEEI